jgi:protein transport protein SEC24
MMAPAHDYFKYLAQECLQQRICVDLYIGVGAKNLSIDLTTIAPVAGITGGDVHFYQNFDVVKHGEKMYFQMFRALTRPVGTDVELKARCSTGLTVTEYIGGQMSSQTASMQYAALDSDKVLTFVMRNDEKLKEDSLVFF